MKNIGLKIVCGTLVCGALFGAGNVSAYEYNVPSEFEIGGSIRTGFEMCVKSEVLGAQDYMYVWNSNNNDDALANWPGKLMEEAESGVYCYRLEEDENRDYNFVIFNNGSSDDNYIKKTADLSVLNDTEGVVNSLVYLFGADDAQLDGTYRGRWAVRDTSNLVSMVEIAKTLKPNDYTIDSYAAVVAALGDGVNVEDVTVDNQGEYNLGADYISKLSLESDVLHKLYILYDGSTNKYSSAYLDAYSVLGEALNNLVERKAIVIDDGIQNGRVTAPYKSNSDSEIEIEVTPDSGYEIESITVKPILSYDELENPVFGEATDIEIEPGETKYDYTLSDLDIEGVYITATFKAEPSEEPYEEPAEDSSEGNVENKDDIAVPNTGKEQEAHQAITLSLMGCMSVGALLGGILGFINRKKISNYLEK